MLVPLQIPLRPQVMTQAGAAVKEEVVRALIVLISNAPELHGYAVRAFYRALASHLDRAEFALVMAATWLIGGNLCSAFSLPRAPGPRRVCARNGRHLAHRWG